MAAYWAVGDTRGSRARDRLREMRPSCAAIMLSRRKKTPSRPRLRPSSAGDVVAAGDADTLASSICSQQASSLQGLRL